MNLLSPAPFRPRIVWIAILLVGALALPAQGQTPPTSWSIECQFGLGGVRPCTNNATFPYADAAEFHEAQLSAATRWLLGLGFAPAHISDVAAGTLSARIVDRGRVVQPGLLAKYGFNNFSQGSISFNANELVYPGRPYAPSNAPPDSGIAVNNLGTSVHELFHAVQAGELTNRGYPKAISDPRRWINEATAEAVMSVWLDQNPPLSGHTAAYDKHRYDESLNGSQVSYEAWAFWRYLGRELGAADDIGYLRDLYDPALVASLGSTDGNSGVDWVHQALQGYNPDGLYYYYPQVIARYMNDETDYGNPLRRSLNRHETITVPEQVAALAAQAFILKINAPSPDPAVLTIDFVGANAGNHALHLIVDDQRYDYDGHGDNIFTTPIDPAEGPKTFLVRVANIAGNPAASGPISYTLRVKLESAVQCTGEGILAIVPERQASSRGAEGAQRALADMDAAYADRVAGVGNYTVVEKTSYSSTPTVIYHEKVTDADKPVFRVVLPDELAFREADANASANGQPTPSQMAEGMGQLMGLLGRALTNPESETNLPPELGVLAGVLADGASGFFQGLTLTNTRADAFDQLADMQLFADRSRLVGEVTVDGRRALLLQADEVEDIDLDQPEDGPAYTLQTARLWLDAEEHVILGVRFDVLASTKAGSWPVLIERRNQNYQPVGMLYEPTRVHNCLAGLFGEGGTPRQSVVENVKILVNDGPPTSQRTADLIRENQ